MSHIEEVQTELKDVRVLEKAIKELFGKVEKNSNIDSQYVGKHKVDYKLTNEFGLIKKDGIYTIFGDFYGTGTTKDRVLKDLNQTYSQIRITESLREQGFSLKKRTVAKNGDIHISFQRW